jgi:hypothetical protein
MRESIEAAAQYIRAKSADLGITTDVSVHGLVVTSVQSRRGRGDDRLVLGFARGSV